MAKAQSNNYDADKIRLQKRECRSWLINKHARALAKVALFLPSHKPLDLQAALAAGRINRHTKIIAIEHDRQRARVIHSYLQKNFDNFYLHTDDAYTLDLNTIVKKFGKIDFAYFDFCGPLSDNLVCWLALQVTAYNVFSLGAKMGFTFSVGRTSSGSTRRTMVQTARENPEFYNWLQSTRMGGTPYLSNLKSGYSKPLVTLLRNILGSGMVLNHTKEYQDTQMPMLFVGLTCVEADKFDDDTFIFSPKNAARFNTLEFMPKGWQGAEPVHTKGWWPAKQQSPTLDPLVAMFKKAKTSQAKAIARRTALRYIKRRHQQAGQPEFRYLAALKMVLTKNKLVF